jgi:transcriptional regulator with XRE-family HTH domain
MAKDRILDSIRRERRRKRLSQAEVARLAGLNLGHISQLETGRSSPRLSTLRDVSRALELELMLVPKALVPAVSAITNKSEEEQDSQGTDRATPAYLLSASEED